MDFSPSARPTAEPEARAVLQDKASVADALAKCFGKNDAITVVVGKDTAEGAAEARPEFKVWSALLGAWSDVFAAMFEHDFAERSRAEVVIEDFSVAAVEAFLRFMYSGVLECGMEALIEVAGLADKYGVAQLQPLCEKGLQRDLTPRNACEMLELADRLGVVVAMQCCLEHIFRYPLEALPHAHVLPARLMEEVLASDLLAINDNQLATILLGWGVDRAVPPERISALLEKHVQLAALTEDECSKAASLAAKVGCGAALESAARLSNRGVHTEDLFWGLWRMYEEQFPDNADGTSPPFLGYWVNLIPSAPAFGQGRGPAWLLEVASGRHMLLAENEEVSWMLPHHAVLLTGVSFDGKLGADACVEVHASRDGAAWHCVLDSGIQRAAHDDDGAVTACRSKGWVRWLKLQARKGPCTDTVHVHGIVQAM